MNFFGKILVVLTFVLSLTFMAFAIMVRATHTNWRAVVTRTQDEVVPGKALGLKYQILAEEEQKKELEARMQKLQSEFAEKLKAKDTAKGELEAAVADQKAKNQELIAARDKYATSEKEAVASLDTVSQNLKKLTEEVGVLREQIRKAQEDRDTEAANVVTLTDEDHKAQQAIDRLTAHEQRLAAQIAKARELLAAHQLDIDSPVDAMAPTMRGKILAVNDQKMVEVDLGSDDGLRVGHKLEIFRGPKYIGRVVVLTTSTDKAIAKIDLDYTKSPVMRGDDVATRLRANAITDQAAAR